MIRKLLGGTNHRSGDPRFSLRPSGSVDPQESLLWLEVAEGARFDTYSRLIVPEQRFFSFQLSPTSLEHRNVGIEAVAIALELLIVEDPVFPKEQRKQKIGSYTGNKRNPELHY
jgi:hypothetical protein